MLTLPIMLSVAACGDDEVVSGGTKSSRSSVSGSIYSSATSRTTPLARKLPFSVGVNVDGMQDYSDGGWDRMPYTYWQYTDGKYSTESDWRNRQNSFAIYREMSAYGKKEWDKVALKAIFLK